MLVSGNDKSSIILLPTIPLCSRVPSIVSPSTQIFLCWMFTPTQKCVRIVLKVLRMSRIIPWKETLTIEFKSDLKKYGDSNLFEDVVAFANTDGGDLYLGVEDDGTITGVHKAHSNPVTLSAYIAITSASK